ncbi:MAG: type II toxin-antitoxin system RelE family toxin [Moorellaceae bacterium]
MWEVHGTRRVVKILEKLASNIKEAVERGFAELSQHPTKGKILRGHKSLRSLAVTTPGGEYRIVYSLKPEDKVVLVILVGPREGFYEQLGRILRE